jgi:hypothetical protein
MKADNIKLEPSSIESRQVPQTNVKPQLLTGNISFLDFFNEQMAFSNRPETMNTSTKGETATVLVEKITESIDSQKENNTPKTLPSGEKDMSLLKKIDLFRLLAENDLDDETLKLDLKNLSTDDLKQISHLLNTPDALLNINHLNGFNHPGIHYNNASYSYKNLNFSQNLSEKLTKAYKKNQPVRIDFDNKSSVILKVDRDGKISAHFISSDKAMEMLLKDNLYILREKFEQEGLQYNELSYKDDSQKEEQKRESEEDE